MAEFRQWWQEQMARLDDGRERKIVAFGAMGLLIILAVGPTVTHALGQVVAAHAPQEVPAPKTVVTIISAPQEETSSSQENAPEDDSISPVAPPLPTIPPLAFLFPLSGAASGGPVNIAVRLESATAVAMLFEVTNPAGETVRTLIASLAHTGEWSALLAAAPGEYIVSVRASLSDGRVVAFKEQRAFQLLETASSPAPADPSEPLVELTAPDPKNGAYAEVAPLGARVKNAEPNTLVFIVTAPDDSETLVLGSEASAHGYWTAMFQGPDGAYRVRARATIGDRDVFSKENMFTLTRARD